MTFGGALPREKKIVVMLKHNVRVYASLEGRVERRRQNEPRMARSARIFLTSISVASA